MAERPRLRSASDAGSTDPAITGIALLLVSLFDRQGVETTSRRGSTLALTSAWARRLLAVG